MQNRSYLNSACLVIVCFAVNSLNQLPIVGLLSAHLLQYTQFPANMHHFTTSHCRRITHRTINSWITLLRTTVHSFSFRVCFVSYNMWSWIYVDVPSRQFDFFPFGYVSCPVTHDCTPFPNSQSINFSNMPIDGQTMQTRSRKVVSNSRKRIYFQTKRILDILWFIMQSLKLPKTSDDNGEDEKMSTRVEKKVRRSNPSVTWRYSFFFSIRSFADNDLHTLI